MRKYGRELALTASQLTVSTGENGLRGAQLELGQRDAGPPGSSYR